MKISIITATWNCLSTLGHCLDSVSGQTYAEVEHIVIDGYSTDGTRELLLSRQSQLARFISEPDDGIYDALNKGLAQATGEVVGFLHADDFYPSSTVLAEVAKIFEDPAVDAVYGDLDYVQKNDTVRIVRRWKSSAYDARKLRRGWMPPHPTLIVRRKWYTRIGGFDTTFRISADYLSILQLFSAPSFRAVYLPQVLVKMRVGGVSNRSLANMMRKSREDMAALRSTGVGGLRTLLLKNVSKIGQFL